MSFPVSPLIKYSELPMSTRTFFPTPFNVNFEIHFGLAIHMILVAIGTFETGEKSLIDTH